MIKDIDFYHLRNVFLTNIKKQLMNTGPDAVKKASKKVHKAGEFLENKDAVTNSNHDNIEKYEPIEKIIAIPPEKRDEILNILRKVL